MPRPMQPQPADQHQRQHQQAIGEIAQMRAEQKARREQSPERGIAEALAVGAIADALSTAKAANINARKS